MGQITAPPNMQLSKLANHLRLMEDLWQKLVYVRWSQESFALLARLGQEMAQFTQEQSSSRELGALAQQLSQHLNACVGAGHLPQESDRERLRALFKQLNHLLRSPDEITAVTTNPLLSSKADVLVVASEKPLTLLSKLGDAGYEVHYLAVAAEIETMLGQTTPTAVIVDIDSTKGPLAGVEMIAELRAREDFLTTPVFFISERDDMEARLEAFRAGGTGYLTKPVDVAELLEGLRNELAQQSEERHRRVLIVNNTPDEAQEFVDLLESRNIGTRTVNNALQVIQEIYRFQPDLLLLDLDVKHVSGLELAGVLAQHKVFDVIPIILLSSAADFSVHLSRLQMGNAWVDLLLKPVIPEYLYWIVQQRLSRGRILSAKLSTLTDKDAATGLYNRRYFLSQLEHNLASLGVSTKTLSVVFVMVENYRALRDATSVTVVDELVEHVAKRMRRVVGPRRWVARFSDAIFAILLTDIPQDALLELSRAVRDTLENTAYELIEYSLRLRTCIGVSVASEPEQDVLSLIRSADAACTRARELKKERIYIQKYLYADWDKTDNQQQQLMSDIEEALNLQRLKLLFQPIVSLQGDQAERYEVLLRIYNPNDQEMPIKTVFNAVQNHPLGRHLDRWIIAEAIRLLAVRRARGVATTLFIKLSAISLADKELPVWLQEQLSTAQLGADHLVFQLSERVAERNVRETLEFFTAIRRLGCGFSLEAFGRGPDSLGLLKTLPADCVKLDLFFSRDVGNDASKQEQLQDLIVRLETLETATIVSGIEDMRALPILWSLGINYVQGFFLQQPYEEMTYDFKDGTF
ncbi:MAG: EAL domain-containing protein [Candidatus Competibacteraceae bacterium]|jgi:diguanylate cyclase (GGDEF)-like protein|nr:EAL domain-containing protein [Candidatus Competibacteraceae bacterium]